MSSKLTLVVYVVCRQLLATGLSGLYSSLPRRLDYPSDDWNHFSAEDVAACPALGMFLNSLEFCNAVVQVHIPTQV